MRIVDQRTPEQIKEHYDVERELADKLRNANKEQRKTLYPEVYNELFHRVKHHPQLTLKLSPENTSNETNFQMGYLRRFLRKDATYLEVGAGDCALAFEVANSVKKAYAVDVSEEVTKNFSSPPANFELIISDGTTIPAPQNSVDIAYSNQLMEHLHPDDALDQLKNLYAALAPNGVYICITPHRFSGPHDVSKYFDREATGFHLKEYTNVELKQLFKNIGFRQVRMLAGAGGKYVMMPVGVAVFVEMLLKLFPGSMRQKIARSLPLRVLIGIRLVGTK